MYFNKFIVSIRSNEKFLKEKGEVVHIPFGDEYSIYLKNVNSLDAVVQIKVDGKVVTGNGKLIVPANSSVEVEGVIEGLSAHKSFKFIERTVQIEEHRGIRPEDGLIEVEYTFEKQKLNLYTTYVPDWTYTYPSPPYIYPPYTVYSTWTNSTGGNSTVSVPVSNNQTNDVGITVEGSDIDRNFGIGLIGDLEEQSNVIILHLRGVSTNKDSDTIIYAKQKVTCSVCGTKSKNDKKYCSECGARLNT